MKLLVLLLSLASFLAAQPKPRPSPWDKKAVPRLDYLITTHPDDMVKNKLQGWLDSGKVKLRPHKVGLILATAEKGEVYLWFDSAQVTPIRPLDTATHLDLLRMDLFCEAVRIDNHFSGKRKLLPLAGPKGENPKQKAQRIWDDQWSFMPQQWEFAKRNNLRQLMPIISRAVGQVENPRSLLYGFYLLLLQQNDVERDLLVRNAIDDIYQRENAKIPPMFK